MCLYAKKSSKRVVPKSNPIIGYKIFLMSGKKKLYSPFRFEYEFINDCLKIYYKDKEYKASPNETVFDWSDHTYRVGSGFFHYFLSKESAVDRRIEMVDDGDFVGKCVIAKCAFWGVTYSGALYLYHSDKVDNITAGASKRMKILEMVDLK